ncbi:hypothetical protein LCGC14_0877330 [marine sediment metagenome]|uniref:Uncharacterized protein n=1 Tax=marine sediment metagenome TaxID=412755 RepID=A0A0F9P7V1_9ZZZZ
MFLFLNIILKIFTKQDIEVVEMFFHKKAFMNKIILRGTKFIKRFIRED